MNHLIKLLAFVFFFCINGVALKAQQKHFIYVQSEDRQQFAIVLNGKVYSSSDYGYIIIPKLADGDYSFTVSFPLNKYPDQAFTCAINKKDAGFFLKNGTEGWALEEMQTQKTVKNNSQTVAQQAAFGNMLSNAVNDSTLTKNTAVDSKTGETAAVAETFATTQKGDTLDVNNAGFLTDSIYQPEKIAEAKLDTGTNMLFVDKSQHGADTINVFIPAEKPAADVTAAKESPQETAKVDTQNNAPALVVPLSANNASTPADNTPLQESTTVADSKVPGTDNPAHEELSNPFYKPEQKGDSLNSSQQTANNVTATTAGTAVNQDCTNTISDEELNKLKRKMFTQNNDNEMIQYALKYVSKKCITTDQVKTLGSLFSSDDGRYNLYDAMYKRVYDYGNYPRLAEQILDPYYKKRFAAMLR